VLKSNRKLAETPEAELRFQGFTRPRVLFLLPTKNACLKMVNTMRDLCEPDQQENRKRFDEGYGDHGEAVGASKPADFRDLFEGDEDDMFRIGIKFAGKTMKFFAPFYSSDVLLASPLGLRTAIGSDEERDKRKKTDHDFLSSIEVAIVDHADALLMQNWEHVEYVFDRLNRQPREAHGCDYNHVRMWYLDGLAGFFRQTVVLSSYNTPELAELARARCRNWAGMVRLQPEYRGGGMIQSLGVKARQTFSRFECPSLDVEPDARFNYFVSAVVPSLTKRGGGGGGNNGKDAAATAETTQGGTLVFVPSYLDFVRLRNFLSTSPAATSLSFGAVSEYASVPEASRVRSHFAAGRHRLLLYTERAHHFRRYVIRGVRRVVFYGLPDNPLFYQEIAGGFLGVSERHGTLDPGTGMVRVLFSRYDAMKLERIVGSQRVGRMISEKGDTFDFV
jgi:U3 small nucleolar RNA-associated protein 25